MLCGRSTILLYVSITLRVCNSGLITLRVCNSGLITLRVCNSGLITLRVCNSGLITLRATLRYNGRFIDLLKANE